jgi:serine/threonine protein phosphatase PrpC
MLLDVAGLTHIGRKKDKNEDSLGIFGEDTPDLKLFKEGALLVVADGLGGHIGGDIASKLAVSILKDLVKEEPPKPNSAEMDVVLDAANLGFLPQIRAAMERANTSIHKTNCDLVQSGRPMGTTLLSALVEPRMAWIGNVGDSRAYHVRGGNILERTADHSWVDEQVALGLMTREEAKTDKRKNMVTRSIGTHPEMEVDTYRWHLSPGDVLLLCTDGLVNMVQDTEIVSVLASPATAREMAARLVELALEGGGKDNITVIVAVVEPSPWRLRWLRLQERLHEKNISLGRVACWLLFGLFCFAAGLGLGLSR